MNYLLRLLAISLAVFFATSYGFATALLPVGAAPAVITNGIWSDWGECKFNSQQGAKDGIGVQQRICTPPSAGGSWCSGVSSRACTVPIAGAWSNYGACTATAVLGSGQQTRYCNSPTAKNGGAPCEGEATRYCPIVVNGAWSAYGACTPTGVDGAYIKARSCNSPAAMNGGLACVGSGTASCFGDAVLAQQIQDAKKAKCEIIDDQYIASNISETGKSCFEIAKGQVTGNREYFLFHSLKLRWNGKNIYGKDIANGALTNIIPTTSQLAVNYECNIVSTESVSAEIAAELKTNITYAFPRGDLNLSTLSDGSTNYVVWNDISSKCSTFIYSKFAKYPNSLQFNSDGLPANFKVYVGRIDVSSLVGAP